MPDDVGQLLGIDAEMVCDAGDSAQCVVVVRSGGVDLADDRVLGADKAGQRRHCRADPVATLVVEDGVERSRRIGQP
jgi:hypothetical protein